MARIETYESRTGVDVRNPINYRPNNDTANAISQLGDAGLSLAASLQRDEEQNAEKAKSRADNLDNLRVQSAILDHQDRVNKYATEQSANFIGEGGSGEGFQKAVATFADKDAEGILSTDFANRTDREEVTLRFRNAGRDIVERSGIAEFDANLKFQGAVTEKRVAGLATRVANNPDDYESAATELVDLTTTTNMDRPNLQRRMTAIGLSKLQRARLESIAGRDPIKFRAAAEGVFADTPAADLTPDLKAVVNGANDAGVDPRVLLSVYSIETDFGRIKSNAKSSAQGPFQIIAEQSTLDEMGLTADQRDDINVVAPKAAAFLARKTDYMKSRGIEPTPGKQYMYWNLGPGVATAVLKADPNTPFSDVVNTTLSNQSPKYRAEYLGNNPRLYNAGMTVGQVLESYEKNMATAGAEADKRVTPNKQLTEDQAQEFFKTIIPGGAPLLTAADLGEVQLLARAKSAEISQEQQDLLLGASIAKSEVKVDARDNKNQNALNKFVVKQGLTAGLVEGDAVAHVNAAKVIDNAGFAPEAFVNAYSASMAGGDIKSKLATYASLADLQQRNPNAYDATKLPADDRSRANEYVALTTVSNLSPDDAVARIDFYRSPEGKKQADAQKAGLQSSKSAEVKELSELDVLGRFDAPWSMSRPKDNEGRFIASATGAYKEQYVFFREQRQGQAGQNQR